MATQIDTRKMATIGLLSAVSVVMVMYRVPFPLAPFLEYDPADIPILIGTLMYGGPTGIIITIIASAIQALTVSAASGFIGFIMHVLSTGCMCYVVGSIYKADYRTTKRLIIAGVAGIITMTVVMVLANYIMTPIFLKIPRSEVVGMLATIIVPFNLIKATINTFLSMLIYKTISKVVQR